MRLAIALLVVSAAGAMWHTAPRRDYQIQYRITYTWPDSGYAVTYEWCNW